MKIHLAYENIDTDLWLNPVFRRKRRTYITPYGDKTKYQRFLIFDLEKRPELLLQDKKFFENIRDSDVDVNIEFTGRFIKKTRRITVGNDYTPVYNYMMYDVLELPDGSLKERVHQQTQGNIMQEIPVRISQELYDPKELMMSYIFRQNLCIRHTNGLSFKFLYDLAKKLADLNKFARVDTFNLKTKKREPLILYDGGRKFPRAFLEGRIKGKGYCLILHLSDQELKIPNR